MKVINILFIVINILFITTLSYNQEKVTKKAKQLTDQMNNEFSLTYKQYNKLLRINIQHYNKIEINKNKCFLGTTDIDYYSKINNEWIINLKKTLSKEQFEEFLKVEKEAKTKIMFN